MLSGKPSSSEKPNHYSYVACTMQLKSCTCKNGKPTLTKCSSYGANICDSCDAGFKLVKVRADAGTAPIQSALQHSVLEC